jgi:uncharacterized protein (DUF1330 family)
MPAYVIACVNDAWDQEKLVEYREGTTEAVARHGGSFVARGGEQAILEGDYSPLRVVIIEFPDLECPRFGGHGWLGRVVVDDHCLGI